MNIINLIELTKNQVDYSTFKRITDDFMENNFHDEYKKLRPTKSTAEKAIQKYINKATYKDDKKIGAYSTGSTVLMIAKDIPEAEKDIKQIDLAAKVLEMIKNKRPAHCYFLDSIALYKALKNQEKDKYFLCIDGHYYDAALVTDMIECIATNKTGYISADICENGALLIKQTSAALILPVMASGCHISKNVNMQDFLRYLQDIENDYFENIRKLA